MYEHSYMIGVNGGSASGKTYLLKRLRNIFSEKQLCIISQDDYYKPKALQPKDSNGIENFDTPTSIDLAGFLEDLRRLRSGTVVHKNEYSFNNPDAVARTITYQPAPVIVAEGIFIFYPEAIASLLDLKVFIEAREDIKLSRRLMRDQEERGYDAADVLYRYHHHVQPCYEKYIEPYKHTADIRLSNNDSFDIDFKILEAHINAIIADRSTNQ